MLKLNMKKIKIDTKTKICESAKKLFNEQETLSITTNHIAKEAGISPGNLYYHFKNKEDIILYIYQNLSKEFESLNSFEAILLSKNPIQTMNENFEYYGKMFYEYRFLLRDAMVLMALYPSFKEAFKKNQDKRINQIELLLQFLIKENILKFSQEQNLKRRAKLHWFITSYWQVFASSSGEVSKESIKEAKEIFFEFMIYPFLSEKGEKMLKEF
ncbi:TetR/AcrR family transcriptional regulator [Arcobacter sp.]|uniref:TetR/AcrR family transcriptional regulator n=2 Tax=Arcobacter sp. TaxID=1872629 RepID=UPI003D0F0933